MSQVTRRPCSAASASMPRSCEKWNHRSARRPTMPIKPNRRFGSARRMIPVCMSVIQFEQSQPHRDGLRLVAVQLSQSALYRVLAVEVGNAGATSDGGCADVRRPPDGRDFNQVHVVQLANKHI